jgi:hypothetical protein
MIIIDTPFHITFSSETETPQYACTGKCKKAWWPTDFEDNPTMGLCPRCSDGLTNAMEGVHFKIIEKINRNLTIKDFEKYIEPGLSNTDKNKLDMMLKNGAKIGNMSVVKPKFIARAIKEWEGDKPGINMTMTFKK